MKKSTIIGLCSATAIFVVLLIVASFYDLQISLALGNADSIFGQFFRLFGELTTWIAIPLVFAILARTANKKSVAGKVLTVLWIVATLVGWFLVMNYLLKEFTGLSYEKGFFSAPYRAIPLYSAIFALFLTYLNLWCAFKIKDETASKLVFIAVAVIFAIAISQLAAAVFKYTWTRLRFRNLDIGNGGTSSEGFTPWYKPGFGKNKSQDLYFVPDSAGMPKKDAYLSFPSGHAVSAGMAFALVLFPETFEKYKKYKVWFWVAPIVYVIIVSLSRIVNRSHYLSDVLFGSYIGGLSVLAGIAITKAIKKAEKKKSFFLKAAIELGAVKVEDNPQSDTETEPEQQIKESQIDENSDNQNQ